MFIPFKVFYPWAILGTYQLGSTFILFYILADLFTYVGLFATIFQEILLFPLFLISPITLIIGILL